MLFDSVLFCFVLFCTVMYVTGTVIWFSSIERHIEMIARPNFICSFSIYICELRDAAANGNAIYVLYVSTMVCLPSFRKVLTQFCRIRSRNIREIETTTEQNGASNQQHKKKYKKEEKIASSSSSSHTHAHTHTYTHELIPLLFHFLFAFSMSVDALLLIQGRLKKWLTSSIILLASRT